MNSDAKEVAPFDAGDGGGGEAAALPPLLAAEVDASHSGHAAHAFHLHVALPLAPPSSLAAQKLRHSLSGGFPCA